MEQYRHQTEEAVNDPYLLEIYIELIYTLKGLIDT
jgi:hypothetical protein